MADKLHSYRGKRNFSATSEPQPAEGRGEPTHGGRRYAVHKHDASTLHYDLRLELDGVLKSWAVTKGPSLDPSDKRLAVETEDHPLEYADFEGTIPEEEYGGGTVMLWDEGTWEPEEGKDPAKGLEKGSLTFHLHGERLRGRWHLERFGNEKGKAPQWLLIKSRDEAARDTGKPVTRRYARSVATGQTMSAIARETPAKGNGEDDDGEDGEDGDPDPARIPRFVPPMLCRARERPPRGEGWLAEVKYDGYRAILRAAPDGVRLLTRGEQDWTDRFPLIAREASGLRRRGVLLDGEIVVFDREGRTDFGALQRAFRERAAQTVRYVAFDLLFADGEDLRDRPIEERKQRLARLMKGGGAILYGDHVTNRQDALYEQARSLGLEGIIAKRAGSRYRSGRHDAWLKVRAMQTAPFVIGAYTGGGDGGLGALVVGGHADGALLPAGRVGTGFTQAVATDLLETLAARERKTSPFARRPEGRRLRFVRPDLVAEVSFLAVTDEGALRHPVFRRLVDMDPADVGLPSQHPAAQSDRAPRPRAAAASSRSPQRKSRRAAAEEETTFLGVRLSNADKALFPEEGITKAALARHYVAHAELMLPHVKERALTLLRCPEGRDRECFFQRHPEGVPERMGRTLEGEEKGVVVVESAADIIELVQLGVLEIHVRGARVDRPDRPDIIVFDLDPGENVAFDAVREGAFDLRDRLADMGLGSFARLTGGKGIHVVVPIERRTDWDAAKEFALRTGERMAQAEPGRYVLNMSKSRRKGRIFFDYLRNDRMSSAIAPYSTRARPGAPFAAPVSWDTLDHLSGPRPFQVGEIVEDDPTATMFELRQRLSKRHFE